ncbi:MAG: hypothetical protein JRJ11_08965 [Deltaproteobacteria bacterium]|nr:hypothetical protein [Deltaproteobacteria bacterium]
MIKSELAHYSLSGMKEWIVFLGKAKVLLGLFINFISVLFIFKALELGRFTYVLPVSVGLNFSLAIVVGYFIFNDHLSVMSFAGIFFILAGIIIMSSVQ